MRSKTKLYRAIYIIAGPLLGLLYKWWPKYVTTTEQLGRAMIKIVKAGSSKSVFENAEINEF